MQNSVEFKAEMRNLAGTGPARATRREEKIPAVIYGLGKEYNIALIEKDFIKFLGDYEKGKTDSKVLNIKLDSQVIPVIIRDVQRHVVTDRPLHIDFQQIDPNILVKVNLKVKVLNEAKSTAIKRGGSLNLVSRQIRVYSLPSQIHQKIEVDVTDLKIGSSLHINDIKLPEGVTPLDKSNFVILSITGRADESEGEEQTN
jgi:large subunit ribosomal protein L25